MPEHCLGEIRYNYPLGTSYALLFTDIERLALFRYSHPIGIYLAVFNYELRNAVFVEIHLPNGKMFGKIVMVGGTDHTLNNISRMVRFYG